MAAVVVVHGRCHARGTSVPRRSVDEATVERTDLLPRPERGVTKLGLDSMLEFMYHIWWLRLTSHRTFIEFCVDRYGLSGCSSTSNSNPTAALERLPTG